MQGKRVVNAARLAAMRRKGSLKDAPPAAAAVPPKSSGKSTMGDRRTAARADSGQSAFDPYKPKLMQAREGGMTVVTPGAKSTSPPGGQHPAARPVQPAYRRALAYVVRRPPPPPPPSKPKWPAAIACILALGMVIGLLASPVGEVFFDIYRHPFYDQFPETARIRVQRLIQTQMNGGSFQQLDVDFAKPLDIPLAEGGHAQRFVTPPATGCSPGCPPATETSKFGQPWFEWQLTSVSQAQFSVLYDVETRTLKWDLHQADAGTVAEIPPSLVTQYINTPNGGKEWRGDNGRYKIDPQNVVLASKALDVSRDKSTALEKAQAIYFFLQGAYTYSQGDIGAEPKDSMSTFESAKGDCDEVSFLFISMLRSVGIPAWAEFGILYDSLQERWVGHAWVQLFLPLKNGGGYFVNADPVNFQWLFRSANRITEWVSDGNEDHLQDYYHIISYQYTSGTPSLSDSWEGIEYQGQGVVYNQDTSREIRYVAASGVVEVIAALAAAMLLAVFMARRRGRVKPVPATELK